MVKLIGFSLFTAQPHILFGGSWIIRIGVGSCHRRSTHRHLWPRYNLRCVELVASNRAPAPLPIRRVHTTRIQLAFISSTMISGMPCDVDLSALKGCQPFCTIRRRRRPGVQSAGWTQRVLVVTYGSSVAEYVPSAPRRRVQKKMCTKLRREQRTINYGRFWMTDSYKYVPNTLKLF